MRILVQVDLSNADLALFEQYEDAVLALLPNHGAVLIDRSRSADGLAETHLLEFPDTEALAGYRADPERVALQDLWIRSGATASSRDVSASAVPRQLSDRPPTEG